MLENQNEHEQEQSEPTYDQREVLRPVEQAEILFYGYPVTAVRLPDGRIGAVLRNMCDALKLTRQPQIRRIREDDTIANSLVLAEVQTKGGFQVTDVLTAWAIPSWLHGIQPSRVAPEKREAIQAFRTKAADVLYAYFSQPRTTALIPSETQVSPAFSSSTTLSEPTKPDTSASDTEWANYYEQMARYYRWKETVDLHLSNVDQKLDGVFQRQEKLEQRQDTMESRVEGVEYFMRFIPDLIEQVGLKTLSSEHQGTVQALVKRLHDLTGIHQGSIYTDLRQSFHVGKYSDIPDDQWEEVTHWFSTRIQAAEKKRSNK